MALYSLPLPVTPQIVLELQAEQLAEEWAGVEMSRHCAGWEDRVCELLPRAFDRLRPLSMADRWKIVGPLR